MGDPVARYNAAITPQYDTIAEGYQAALKVVDDVVLKNYISDISNMEVVPVREVALQDNIQENVRLFKITEMVYEKAEFSSHKFASVFNTLTFSDSAVFLMIDSDGSKTDFYMGIRSIDEYRTTSSLKNMLENALRGQFPGIKTENYTTEQIEDILSHIKVESIAAVSCVADGKREKDQTNENFVQGLEKFVFSMQGERYTGIILANRTTQAQLRQLRREYETVYTQLSPFSATQVNYTKSNSKNQSRSETTGRSMATSYTENRSNTSGHTTTKSVSRSDNESRENIAGKTIKGVSSAAALLGAALAPITGGISLVAGGVLSGSLGMMGSVVSKNISNGTSESNSSSINDSQTLGTSRGNSDTRSQSQSSTEGETQGLSEGMLLTIHDKTVDDILERINRQLKRIDEFESLGMYECAAYFLSDNQYAAEIAAATYKALMRGENSGVEVSAINSWGGKYQKEEIAQISRYIKNFMHPVFRYYSAAGAIEVTPCSFVSGNELAIHMGLPRKSVSGLPVIEHVDFGREVVSYSLQNRGNTLNLGNVFNMGSNQKSQVKLDVDSLSMHTFITGATGSGKSNTVYEILRQLQYSGVNYMVIEPAKGEYKNVFGNRRDVHVLGTNPQITDVLRINPFRFPMGVHVLEHIDRLIEIFNVCWPMYAAMPAVLKEAVLQAYMHAGWDLEASKNHISQELFPTFLDLQKELEDVVRSSAYSDEVKGNYIGSLVTRVKSLTNGLNGMIFSANEVNNDTLFDSNVIVDLSRVGSLETKALIMGVLVMRLNEHRMTQATEMNAPLRHVTVLEEAHNILKRTATEQSSESPNLTGKSVEMLSNSIAEMRTYGEGFIIADQSPSAVDVSAIRNTNTKIIMRLPDENDRRVAGKSAALRDDQVDEIAKLSKGVAVVYQNDWLEPVLCHISKFSGQEQPFQYDKMRVVNPSSNCNDAWVKRETLTLLMGDRLPKHPELDIDRLMRELPNASLPTGDKIRISQYVREYQATGSLRIWKDEKFADLSKMVTELLGCKLRVENLIRTAFSFDELNRGFSELIQEQVAEVNRDLELSLCQCFMKSFSEDYPEQLGIYAAWEDDIRKERGTVI
ncbi:MAG: ATP-binding protein [Firmicutes bacterium]|nr:ATP-binding protein [Bacillota bacterium]